MLSKLWTGFRKQKGESVETVKVETVIPKKVAINSRAVSCAVNFVKTSMFELSGERFYSLMRGSGFDSEITKAILDYLGVRGILWLDRERNLMRIDGTLFNCAKCQSFVQGDGWHSPSRCGTKILMILKNDAGKNCSGWRPKCLNEEMSEGWKMEV